MTEKSRTVIRIAVYGAMGIGTTTFSATAVNADICYTDLTGSELVFTSTSPVTLDLDGDGTDDFRLELGLFGPNTYGSSSWVLNLRAVSAGQINNRVAAFSDGALNRLNQGDSISGRNFSRTNGYLQRAFTSYNPSNAYGAWLPGAGFAAIRFEDGMGNTRFGWIQMSIDGTVADGDFSDIEVTISGFAFAKDEAIVASQTVSVPEPTSLGLLALWGSRTHRSSKPTKKIPRGKNFRLIKS